MLLIPIHIIQRQLHVLTTGNIIFYLNLDYYQCVYIDLKVKESYVNRLLFNT